ncbi:hypothetical protein PJN36_01485 [Mycobacterium kansasii]
MTVEPDAGEACVVTAGGDEPERMALYFAMVGAEFEVLEPAEARRRRVLWANVFVVTVRHRKVRSCNWFRRHPPSCS